ncbi:MAG: hypothetical protein ACXWV9_02885 [Flavisolibacter sp.]
MKKIFTLLFLLLSCMGLCQEDQRNKDSMFLFAPTEKGIPDGEAVSKKIGKEGGSLFSSDKKLEIIIPPGALTSEKTISIQPVTNLAKAGIGKTYYMEPSGLQFLQPVELIFHYTDQNIEEGSPQLLSISTQDKKGNWLRFENVKVDTVSKTISGNTLHFSGYVMSWSVVMWAHTNRVKVGKEVGVKLYLTPVNAELEKASLKDFIGAHFEWFGKQTEHPRNWSVNGIAHGNSLVGSIIEPPYDYNVVYKSPALVPENNPVLIEVEITGIPFEGKLINVKRKTTVQVYDNWYEVNMLYALKGGSPKAWGGNSTTRDEGSFIVSFDKKDPELIKISNKFEVLTYDNCPDRTVLNPATCTGLLHVKGIKSSKLTPANAPALPYATIELWFDRHPVEATRFRYNCPQPPGFKGNRAQGAIDFNAGAGAGLQMLYNQAALPHSLKFLAKDGEQVTTEYGKPGGDYYLKIWVRRLEE